MDKDGSVKRQLAQLEWVVFVILGLLVRIGDATGVDRTAASIDEFLTDELGALLGALCIGGPEDHPVPEIEDQDIGLILISVRRQQRNITLSEDNQRNVGFADLAGNGVIAHPADRGGHDVLELLTDQETCLLSRRRPRIKALWRSGLHQ